MKGTFYWSVRRELWEHRSVWLAPLSVAVLVLVAFALGAGGHFEVTGKFSSLSPAKQRFMVSMPFSLTASAILFVAFVVGAFYCLDALNTERKDRSILFWKSMPVSDTATVLSKAFVPIAVIPAVALAIALATQAILFVFANVVLRAKGFDVAPMLERLPIVPMTVAMLYGVAAHALWYAPLYALLLVASVATRRPLLWVVVPVIVVQLLEKVAFNTNYSGAFIKYRLLGGMGEAFRPDALKEPITSFSQLDPVRFLMSPGLWLGLLAAAALIYVAIRLRRQKEPL